MRKQILSFAAVLAVAASSLSSAAPAAAFQTLQPYATNNLVVSHLNITAQAAPNGPGYYESGDLKAGQYIVVTASGITDSDGVARPTSATTLVFHSNDGVGNDISKSERVQNGVPTLVNFGRIANPNNDGSLILTFYAGQKQSNVSLVMWSPNL